MVALSVGCLVGRRLDERSPDTSLCCQGVTYVRDMKGGGVWRGIGRHGSKRWEGLAKALGLGLLAVLRGPTSARAVLGVKLRWGTAVASRFALRMARFPWPWRLETTFVVLRFHILL